MNQKPRVIIIEDDDRFRQTLALEFRDRKFEVSEYADPSRIPNEPQQNPTWIALDLRLVHGLSLSSIPNLKELFPNSKIILMTGYGSVATAIDAIKRGAENYIQKPFSIEDLIAGFEGTTKVAEPTQLEAPSLARREREYIEFVLNQADGNISKAAKKLGIHRQSLQRKLKKYPPMN